MTIPMEAASLKIELKNDTDVFKQLFSKRADVYKAAYRKIMSRFALFSLLAFLLSFVAGYLTLQGFTQAVGFTVGLLLIAVFYLFKTVYFYVKFRKHIKRILEEFESLKQQNQHIQVLSYQIDDHKIIYSEDGEVKKTWPTEAITQHFILEDAVFFMVGNNSLLFPKEMIETVDFDRLVAFARMRRKKS